MYNEKVGKSSKTVDFQLEQKIEKIKDTKTRYTRLLGIIIVQTGSTIRTCIWTLVRTSTFS